PARTHARAHALHSLYRSSPRHLVEAPIVHEMAGPGPAPARPARELVQNAPGRAVRAAPHVPSAPRCSWRSAPRASRVIGRLTRVRLGLRASRQRRGPMAVAVVETIMAATHFARGSVEFGRVVALTDGIYAVA